ncbi:MAG: Gx transporter family protein [Clostridia bacterium]|nr:Gx transporter family protein [Clostridia bacterium]
MTRRITRTALLFSLCIILSVVESAFLTLPTLPGVKLGLSNLPVMYSLYTVNFPLALSLCLARSLFAFITRGFSACLLSLAGGCLSVLLMQLLLKTRSSIALVSVTGGISHNVGQLAAVSLLWSTPSVFSLSPVLIISGTVFGILNAVLLRVTIPYLKKIGGGK